MLQGFVIKKCYCENNSELDKLLNKNLVPAPRIGQSNRLPFSYSNLPAETRVSHQHLNPSAPLFVVNSSKQNKYYKNSLCKMIYLCFASKYPEISILQWKYSSLSRSPVQVRVQTDPWSLLLHHAQPWELCTPILRPHPILPTPVHMIANHCQGPSREGPGSLPQQGTWPPLLNFPTKLSQASFSWLFLFVPSCSAPVHINWKTINSLPHALSFCKVLIMLQHPSVTQQDATILDSWAPLFEFGAAKVIIEPVSQVSQEQRICSERPLKTQRHQGPQP